MYLLLGVQIADVFGGEVGHELDHLAAREGLEGCLTVGAPVLGEEILLLHRDGFVLDGRAADVDEDNFCVFLTEDLGAEVEELLELGVTCAQEGDHDC